MSATLVVASIAFLAGLALTRLAISMGQRLQLLDLPTAIKPHGRPVPHTGGTAIVVVAATTMVGLGLLPLALAAVCIWAIGVADDVRSLPPRLKLVLEAFALVLGASALGLSPLPMTLAVIVGVILVNAFNVIDGLDGLAAGCALAPLLVFMSSDGVAGLLASSVAASVAAFLVFNRHPAKIFLGDEGSLLLGFTLWTLPFLAGVNSATPRGALFWLELWLFPLVNAGFVIAFRLRAHRPIMRGDRSHLYDFWHKHLGLPATLLACWSIAALGAVGAVAMGMP
jgi:UDP-GlcNAc:undecaprenyl-phosphate GlcNAc-1-phosphate transferase